TSFGQTDVPAGTTTYTLSTVAGPERLIAEELVGGRPIKLATIDATVVDGATQNFDLAAGFAPVTHALTASAALGSASLSYRDARGFGFGGIRSRAGPGHLVARCPRGKAGQRSQPVAGVHRRWQRHERDPVLQEPGRSDDHVSGRDPARPAAHRDGDAVSQRP